jgi:hypothetical protein
MMKRSLALVTVMLFMPSASADVYVKVDSNGNAIGGAIMCDASTCANDSEYSKLTLNEGERYVLQGVGVHHGIGNNNLDTGVKHNDVTNEWIITRNESTPAPTVERFTVITPSYAPTLQETTQVKPITTETQTVSIETSTVLSDTATVISGDVFNWESFWVQFQKWFTEFIKVWGKI